MLLHLHLVILQMLLSKATYNWEIHKAIHLEEANRQRKCSYIKSQALFKYVQLAREGEKYAFFFRMKSSSVERDQLFSVVA